jgi:pimeloyl-ACP methyl ester carboxylesterase
MSGIRRFYGQTSFGQVHARIAPSVGDELHPPLVCLHPAPSSGLYFTTAMTMLDEGRRVIAPDYPGYGGSDAPDEPPAIEDYARVMLEFLEDIHVDGPVDVLGFHTGCLVGSEMALLNPAAVRKLVLCDVPYFTAEVRPGLKEKNAVPLPVSGELHSLAGAWSFNVEKRIADVPLPRALELFAEHLRAGTRDFYGFNAAFSYACEERMPELVVPTTVLATQSGLHDPSEAVANVIPNARFVDVPEVTTAVFETGAEAICKRINAALL